MADNGSGPGAEKATEKKIKAPSATSATNGDEKPGEGTAQQGDNVKVEKSDGANAGKPADGGGAAAAGATANQCLETSY